VNVQKMRLKAWEIRANLDEDGHLTLTIHHDDGSKVCDTQSDVSDWDGENCWGERFTTEAIEAEYRRRA